MPEVNVKFMKKELDLKKLELSALLEVTQAINGNLTDQALYKIYHFTLLAQLQISRLGLFVLEDNWECKVNFGTNHNFLDTASLPPAITCLTEISYITDLNLDAHWGEFETVVPILQNRKILAFVLIGNSQAYYSTLGALSFVQTLSNIILVAMQNRRMARLRLAEEAIRNEIKIAREVQTMLFPKSLPNDDAVAIHASYLPHSSIGGDYYDYVPIDEDQFLFCIADVSGKGVPASLLMSNFQAGLRTILRQTPNLLTVVTELNHLIYCNAIAEKFVTAFFGIYNRRTNVLSYVNAGHNSPVLLHENSTVQLLTEGCTMLGIFESLPFISVTEVPIPNKSLIMCYTDGLTEVFNTDEDEYGLDNTIKFLQNYRYLPLPKLHEELLEEIKNHNQGSTNFHDDITLLSCRFK
ncbi:PP2C family protein-serine/threonine phosphatase [Adhaeribacter radiodurans]|uniref:PP2C family protein-serine/threonine phosphatase n=1 Tax=Adhaeribacter radiodurans TaxID=2745197 RepID=A0A7L7LEU7_9BACT|nr:PP2C family protein-serine/threonine phosphatase [Adhaeribacter radiodurans]QMU31350.1 PP2C family protein-serine/threonine phosphatase [Adhaeribacter radiodurans]